MTVDAALMIHFSAFLSTHLLSEKKYTIFTWFLLFLFNTCMSSGRKTRGNDARKSFYTRVIPLFRNRMRNRCIYNFEWSHHGPCPFLLYTQSGRHCWKKERISRATTRSKRLRKNRPKTRNDHPNGITSLLVWQSSNGSFKVMVYDEWCLF